MRIFLTVSPGLQLTLPTQGPQEPPKSRAGRWNVRLAFCAGTSGNRTHGQSQAHGKTSYQPRMRRTTAAVLEGIIKNDHYHHFRGFRVVHRSAGVRRPLEIDLLGEHEAAKYITKAISSCMSTYDTWRLDSEPAEWHCRLIPDDSTS
ncbi:predicted protein [Histoplasma capsulatum var. duboisii H88]|uniref:Predicted protein n=2 Tax=Ajellomyces capsulatus TaxID=5037 RepID=F0UHQ5_AJEC8|nr:predicted protein [Histoplasma capsulatum H143]EGC46264.1 predicted protein [Histoplasma capsulatum var. duboisii H88]